MCGIYGLFNPSGLTLSSFKDARDRLLHRGPDSASSWIEDDGCLAFGHRRLSIVDLSESSGQPFISACGRYVIVFNGEIYNYKSLRSELQSLGYSFFTSGDTEVLLTAFIAWGYEALSRLNGMFAFVIYDRKTRKLHLSRDRLGKKPFYYYHNGRVFEFSSELKSIQNGADLDFTAINQYLNFGYIPEPFSLVKGVLKLPAAHYGEFCMKTGKLQLKKYWSLPELTAVNSDFEQVVDEQWSLLVDATKIRLENDVPTGVFLSGGLDSSLIVAAACEANSRAIKTFSMTLKDSSLDESKYSHLIAKHFKTEHYELHIDKIGMNAIEDIKPFIDEPIADSSIIPTFLLSKLTSQHVKVALGGDGGDEIYGGYSHYQSLLKERGSIYGRYLKGVLSVAGHLAMRLPAGVKGRNKISSLREGVDFSIMNRTAFYDNHLRKKLLGANYSENILNSDLVREFSTNTDLVDALMRYDFQTELKDGFLVKVDRATMANSLEVRNPFLDYRCVEHSYSSIPTIYKATKHDRRLVQKEMAKRYLPSSFDLNRKQGFSIDIDDAMKDDSIRSKILDSQLGFIDRFVLERMYNGLYKGRSNGARLFAVLMLIIALENRSSKV